jgi:hypothetical protein
MAHAITTTEKRFYDAIKALSPLGPAAAHRARSLRSAQKRHEELTLEHAVEFLEAMAPLYADMLRDEAANEEELGHRRTEDLCVRRFFDRVLKAKP